MMGVAIGPSDKTPDDASQTVNGNYGFATSKLNLYPPGNAKNPAPDHQLPLYADLAAAGLPGAGPEGRPTTSSPSTSPTTRSGAARCTRPPREEDVNVFDGDAYLPQENFADHPCGWRPTRPGPPTPDVTEPTQPPSQQAGIISPCAGALHKVDVTHQPSSTAVAAPSRARTARPARPSSSRSAPARRPRRTSTCSPTCRSRRTSGA